MDRLHNPRVRYAAVLSTAAALAGVLIGASQVGADNSGASVAPTSGQTSSRATLAPASPEPSLFAGIEQHGAALGSANAPVTLVEYADLQCPYCAQWARHALPTLVEDYVKPGKLRIVFRGLAFTGPDSDKALRTAVAAGENDHLWDVVHGLYLNQGNENAGWVTDALVAKIAASAPGLDGAALLDRRWDRVIASEINRAAQAAQAAGVTGTPAFQAGPTGGPLELVRVDSLGPEGIVPAIKELLSR
jgi:protein-disulfide isomerase